MCGRPTVLYMEELEVQRSLEKHAYVNVNVNVQHIC